MLKTNERDRTKAELDVRSCTTAQRYERVLTAFEALREGSSLRIIVDHEPRAFRLRLGAMHAGHYVWAQRNLDEDYWEATITRVAPLVGATLREAALHCSALFTDLPREARRTLAQATFERSFHAGESVVEQGTAWPYVGLVTAGSVAAVVNTDAGRDYYLYYAFPSDVFGEIQALDTGVTIARFVARATETEVLLLPREPLLELAETDGKFMRRLATVCAQRARLTHEMLYARATKSTIARLAATILPYATPVDGTARALQPLPSMTQSELASAAGTVKDVVGRDLATLRAAGAIDLRGGRVAGIDEAKLRAFL